MPGYTLLQRVDVTTDNSIVVFPGIPQSGYTDLVIKMSIRGTASGQYDYLFASLNGDGDPMKFENRDMYQLNGSTGSENYLGVGQLAFVTGNVGSAGQHGITTTTIPSYTSSLKKTLHTLSITENSASNLAIPSFSSNLWSDTEAIFSLHFWISNTVFKAGTSFSLYGRSALGTLPSVPPTPISATIAGSGGTIVQKDGYAYHYFGYNGVGTSTSHTFSLSASKTADILVVAGGGAGGGIVNNGTGNGGGGAGGYLSFTGQSLSSGSHSIVVGVGGTGGTSTGGSGSNSQFASLTAAVGGGGGGTRSTLGTAGGSSGGTGSENASFTSPSVAGQGNRGGGGAGAPNYGGGGGGGAGAIGSDGTGTIGGAGGVGLQWLDGNFYASGGGGGVYNGGTRGTGGRGGGGYAGRTITGSGGSNGSNGIPGTGGGGGGSSNAPSGGSSGGFGGSGIVIVRYPI
jgi:hypothetical protein